jgi:selenocysteine-specific elongation factor
MTYVIGTAGHVDHGKSTLVEVLTGIDPDRLAEEKERAMTIDLGFAWLTLPDGEVVGVVDVPGHRDFIENMLAGVGGIDLALFVIAADEGVMPQSREHLAILDLLDVPGGVVALTKVDVVNDPEWLDLVILDVEELLAGTVLEGAPIVPVSALTGEGLDDLIDSLAASLVECTPQPDRGYPRLPVDRVFTISGFGTVVTGTLIGGRLVVGDEIEIQPSGRRARVRGLQSHKEAIEVAAPGSRVAINLSGIDKDEIQRGEVVAKPGLLRATTLIDVQYRHLETAQRALTHNTEVKFFSGAAESVAYVRLVGDRELPPGHTGWLQLRLMQPVAVDRGDRYILRLPSPPETIGGGMVLDSYPPNRWRRFKEQVIERFETLAAGSPDELVLQALEAPAAMTPAQLAGATGLALAEIDAVVVALVERGVVMALPGDWLIAHSSWLRTVEHLKQETAAYHQAFPLRQGIPREALRSKLGVDGKLFVELIAQAVRNGALVDEGTVLRLPDHTVTFTHRQQSDIETLIETIARDPINTPSVKEIIEQVGEDVFAALVTRGDLVQVENDVIFDAVTYDRLVEQVVAYVRVHGAITVADARDLFGTSRKYVLGLLEHLDGEGITRRTGDERVLGRAVRNS